MPKRNPDDPITVINLDNGSVENFDHRQFGDRLADLFVKGALVQTQ